MSTKREQQRRPAVVWDRNGSDDEAAEQRFLKVAYGEWGLPDGAGWMPDGNSAFEIKQPLKLVCSQCGEAVGVVRVVNRPQGAFRWLELQRVESPASSESPAKVSVTRRLLDDDTPATVVADCAQDGPRQGRHTDIKAKALMGARPTPAAGTYRASRHQSETRSFSMRRATP